MANDTTAVSFTLPVGFSVSRSSAAAVTYADSAGSSISVAVSRLSGSLRRESALPILGGSARQGCYVPDSVPAAEPFTLSETIESPCVTPGMRPVVAAAGIASAPVAKTDPSSVLRHDVLGAVSSARDLVVLDYATQKESYSPASASSFVSSVRVVPLKAFPQVGVPAVELPEAMKDRGMVPRDACQVVAASDFGSSAGAVVASNHPSSLFGADSVCEVWLGSPSSSGTAVWYPNLVRVVVSSFPFGVQETARRLSRGLDQPLYGRVDEVHGMPRLVGTVVRSQGQPWPQPGAEALVSVGPQRTLRVAVVGSRGALTSYSEQLALRLSGAVAGRVASGSFVPPFAPSGTGRSLLGVSWRDDVRVTTSTPPCALVTAGVSENGACRLGGPMGTQIEVRPWVGRSLITAALTSPRGPGSANPAAVTTSVVEGNTFLSATTEDAARGCIVLDETTWAEIRITGATSSTRAEALQHVAAEVVRAARAL